MKLYAIETGNFKLDGGAMFGVVPKTPEELESSKSNLFPILTQLVADIVNVAAMLLPGV